MIYWKLLDKLDSGRAIRDEHPSLVSYESFGNKRGFITECSPIVFGTLKGVVVFNTDGIIRSTPFHFSPEGGLWIDDFRHNNNPIGGTLDHNLGLFVIHWEYNPGEVSCQINYEVPL